MPVSMTRSMKNTLSFFKRLFGKTNGLIEIRCLPSKERIFNRDLKKLITFIQDNMDQNVYFGAATRKGKGGSKNYALEIPALWVDIDWKDFKRGKAEAMRLLKRFPLKPSIVVFTGHGMHVYWILQKPEKATSEIEGYLKGLALELKGDLSATELARILRVPGTFNYKYGEKLPVTRSIDNALRYDLEDFEQWRIEIPRVVKQTVKFTRTPMEVDVQKFKISPHIMKLILQGWQGDPYRSRSEADQAVITSLVRKRISDDEIRAIFQKYAIGAKYGEKKQFGDEYLASSISKAKAYLAGEEEKNIPPLKRLLVATNGRNRKIRMAKATKKMDRSKHETAQKYSTRKPVGPIRVKGELRPLVKKGPRVMICVDYEIIPTRFGPKDVLHWCEENIGLELPQFFNHEDPYPVRSKAVRNYFVALQRRPNPQDQIDLWEIVGLRAKVSVQTVKKTSKGKLKPKIFHESKVDEILRPIGRVNVDLLQTLKKRRKKIR